MSEVANFFELPPGKLPEELIEILAAGQGGFRLERIISEGQSSPPGFWYDQTEAEWVLLLQGAAELVFEDASEPLRLAPGESIFIAPHRRHRVSWTDPSQKTLWLAVFFMPSEA